MENKALIFLHHPSKLRSPSAAQPREHIRTQLKTQHKQICKLCQLNPSPCTCRNKLLTVCCKPNENTSVTVSNLGPGGKEPACELAINSQGPGVFSASDARLPALLLIQILWGLYQSAFMEGLSIQKNRRWRERICSGEPNHSNFYTLEQDILKVTSLLST